MTPQESIAHYRITAKIGEGGMGAVYRATDTKLARDVAIKVIPDAFAQDPDRLARFTREAQVLASLNHPNIAAIYGVEDRALVMELVEGATLAERIAQGPIPADEALPILNQLVDALEYAHEKGIIHRDLKPANIKITPEGRVKVLDFGLAKALGGEAATADPASSPTLTMRATMAGMIMGTAGYMSPEQARGQSVDKRADIWAFGVVISEMLSGKHLFAGPTVSDILAAVLTREPELESVPTPFRRLAAKCLVRDQKLRMRDIGDARLLLEEPVPAAAPSPRPGAARIWPAAAGVTLAAGLGLGWWIGSHWRTATAERTLRLQIAPPPGLELVPGATGTSAISPDARLAVFIATGTGQSPRLWLRALDSLAARELPGTERASFPFWSPDSKSIGFFADGKLKRMDLAGGSPTVLADAPNGRGGTWNRDGVIVFASGTTSGLTMTQMSGGKPVPLTAPDRQRAESGHRWPYFLPDGRRFLYFVFGSKPEGNLVCLSSLDHPREKVVLLEGVTASAVYAPPRGGGPGRLLWARRGLLTAQALDADHGRLSGEAQSIPDAVLGNLSVFNPGFTVANDGTILISSGSDLQRLTWFSRDGRVQGTVGQPDQYTAVRISPDGTRVAVAEPESQSSGNRDIWIIDFARGIRSRFTTGGKGVMPVWSRDSQRIAHYGLNSTTVYVRSAGGAGGDEVLVESQQVLYGDDFAADGRFLYEDTNPETQGDLWILPAAGDRKPVPYLKTPANEINGTFSPDGKWVAYSSDESGQQEIFVQSVPASETKWQVSSGGGNFPRWRKDGSELFYRSPDGRLMVAAVHSGAGGLEFGAPAALFRTAEPIGPHTCPYDVAPDGQRILALIPETAGTSPLTVLINWQAELKK